MIRLKRVYTRRGYCMRCGVCCTLSGFPVGASGYGVNPEVEWDEDGYCTKLDRETMLCTDYENRPPGCRKFPSRPRAIMLIPQCTYWFEGKVERVVLKS